MKVLAVLAVAALLAAGCGGGDGGDEEASPQPPAATTQTPANTIDELPPEEQFAYQEGLEQCSFYSLKDLAGTLGVPAKPEPVARAMARDEPNRKIRDAIRRGCLEALRELEKG